MTTTYEAPELTAIEKGGAFKVLQIKGKTGMIMPQHHSTKEAVVIVQKGKALLNLENVTHILERGACVIIPAGANHSLSIKADFTAIAVMALDSSIEFN